MDIFEQVKKILCDQLDLEEEQVNEDSEVIDDLGADSLDIVDLVMTLEEEFDTEIPDEDIENLKTVGDIVKYIEDRVAEYDSSALSPSFGPTKTVLCQNLWHKAVFFLWIRAKSAQLRAFLLNLSQEGNIIKGISAACRPCV